MKTITTLKSLANLVNELGVVFVRWSKGYAADKKGGFRSKNHATGAMECGLSVQTLTREDAAKGEAWLWRLLLDYQAFAWHGAKPYLCTGTVVGRGSDGEDCITDVVQVAVVAKALWCPAVATVEAKQIAELEEEITHDAARLQRLTDPSAINATELRLERARLAVAAMKAGRRWYDDVERAFRSKGLSVGPHQDDHWRGILVR